MLLLRRLVPPCLLLLFGWMALSVSSRNGVTFDESAHLAAGTLYWARGDYRFQPENGIFPQRWAALPLVLAGITPATDDETARQGGDVWWYGRELLFFSGYDTATLLFMGRAMVVILGIALLVLIWQWARRLYGPIGGWLALALAAFSPTLLAHGALITSDVAAAFAFLLAVTTWWRLCHRLTIGRVIAAGIAIGLLAISKFSAVLFGPMALLILLVRAVRRADLPWQFGLRRGRLHRWQRLIGWAASGGSAVLLAVIVIWTAYGFRYQAGLQPGDEFVKSWHQVLNSDKTGFVRHTVEISRRHHLLPEGWLYGFAFTVHHAKFRPSYFAGEYRNTGWVEFFPTAFLLKTTPPVLLALLAALYFTLRRPATARSRRLYRISPLLILAGVYLFFAITSSLNIGHRHLLPVYPVLFILLGSLADFSGRKPRRIALVGLCALVSWQVFASLHVRPHYLTYFNELAGGPTRAHRFFVDSSLDWGQGLPDLAAWLVQNANDQPVYLSYFGTDEPNRFNLKATRIGDLYFDHGRRNLLPKLTAGLYCISATMFQRVYTQVPGPWSAEYDRMYWEYAHVIATNNSPATDALETFEQLRFGRLCHFLQQRRPDAIVANVFFVYKLDEAEIDIALNQPVP